MLEPPILFMVTPGCENVLGNFFPVPLMVAALGALQWKRYQHRCLSGLEAAAVPGGLWKFLAFGSVFCTESLVGCSSQSQSAVFFKNTYCRHITGNHSARRRGNTSPVAALLSLC